MTKTLSAKVPRDGRAYVNARISADSRRKGLEKSWAKQREIGARHRNNIVEIQSSDPPNTQLRGSRKLEAQYPACPVCPAATGLDTIRAGYARGIQLYRCQLCRRRFSGPTIRIKLEPLDYEMLCYHCGSKNVRRIGKGANKSRTGRMGFCNSCNRRFVQGGLKDLRKYHLLLTKRILEACLPDDVREEVSQMAAEDVLIGKGYCWTVSLRIKEAWRNARGEYAQKGSDHPVFRFQ